MSFNSFKFHPQIEDSIKVLGYHVPTPIQQQAIPPVLAGKDVMGLAQTGTGKTAAFVLPIIQRLLPGPRGKLRSLIIAPTRELAEQIHASINELGRNTHLKSCTIYGGVGIDPQIKRLRTGVDIVVACPGRLLDHIGQETVSLANLETFVLDEADRMFDMGFLPDIRRIVKHVPLKRQTLMFSATMPDSIRKLAKEMLNDPITVEVGHIAPASTVSHGLYPVELVPGKPDSGQALADGENDPSVCVVPRVGLVLAKHGELHPVDGQKLVEGHPEGQGRQNVDLHQGLPAGEIRAESALPAPLRSEFREKVLPQAGIR